MVEGLDPLAIEVRRNPGEPRCLERGDLKWSGNRANRSPVFYWDVLQRWGSYRQRAHGEVGTATALRDEGVRIPPALPKDSS